MQMNIDLRATLSPKNLHLHKSTKFTQSGLKNNLVSGSFVGEKRRLDDNLRPYLC